MAKAVFYRVSLSVCRLGCGIDDHRMEGKELNSQHRNDIFLYSRPSKEAMGPHPASISDRTIFQRVNQPRHEAAHLYLSGAEV